ncbi:MAG TPA: response regulator [Candidatus Microsaccharimonas sp.]|nr:response regulator [Candidatus Microsaccharimonas sp.]
MEPQNKKTILLADDEQFIVIAYKDGLERAGYSVVVAHDGEEALQQAQATHPDLILLDLIMPKMNGFEVLRSLKEDANCATIPVVVLTNLSQSNDEEEARTAGAVDFVVKADISLKDLLARIEHIFA